MGFQPEGELILLNPPLPLSELMNAGDSLRPEIVPLTFLPTPKDATFAISEPVPLADATIRVWVGPHAAFVAVDGPEQYSRFRIHPEEGSADILLRRPISSPGKQSPEFLLAGTVSLTSHPTSE